MDEPVIENGTARVGAGEWLVGRTQPAASRGTVSVKTLRGVIVPDRIWVRSVKSSDSLFCASADAPFLTRLEALPDAVLSVASAKLLVAPARARVGAKAVKLVPLSFQRSLAVTRFQMGWVLAGTRGRVTRTALEDGATLMVRPEAVVAWSGADPSGFCPKLSVLDVLLPRGPRNLAYTFHGPCVVWFEGSAEPRVNLRPRRFYA